MHCTQLTLRRMKTDLWSTDKFIITAPLPQACGDERFKTTGLCVGIRSMPFQKYAAHFGPAELATMRAAFDAIWEDLNTAGLDLSTEDRAALMKKKLAQRILVSATAGGVRDVETMKEQAMRSLGRGVRPGSEQTLASEAA